MCPSKYCNFFSSSSFIYQQSVISVILFWNLLLSTIFYNYFPTIFTAANLFLFYLTSERELVIENRNIR